MKTLFNVYGIHEALIDDNGNLREDLRPGQIVEANLPLLPAESNTTTLANAGIDLGQIT